MTDLKPEKAEESLLRLDIGAAFTKKLPPRDYVLPGLVAGTVGALVAPGGTGKSMLALQIACAVASDQKQANTTGLGIERHGRVLYLNLEDPPSEIEYRLASLASRFDKTTRESVSEGLHMSPLMGVPTDVMNERTMKVLLKEAQDTRLVIVDTLTRAHGLDENDNGQMSRLVTHLERVVRETGAALLYLHHTSKAATLSGQGSTAQAARGASVLTDNPRFCGNLVTMSDAEAGTLTDMNHGGAIGAEWRHRYVRYETPKVSYGEAQSTRWYRRADGGILEPVALRKANKNRTDGRDVA